MSNNKNSNIKNLNTLDILLYTQKNEEGIVFCTSEGCFYSAKEYMDVVNFVNFRYIYNVVNRGNIKEKLDKLDKILYLNDNDYVINYDYRDSLTSGGNDYLCFGNKFYAIKIYSMIKDEVIKMITHSD